jgi:hypothetical protein
MSEDPRVRVVDRIEDTDGMAVFIGVDYGTVTIHAGTFVPGGGIRLESSQADEFARAFNAACWEAAGQDAELRAGAGDAP